MSRYFAVFFIVIYSRVIHLFCIDNVLKAGYLFIFGLTSDGLDFLRISVWTTVFLLRYLNERYYIASLNLILIVGVDLVIVIICIM